MSSTILTLSIAAQISSTSPEECESPVAPCSDLLGFGYPWILDRSTACLWLVTVSHCYFLRGDVDRLFEEIFYS